MPLNLIFSQILENIECFWDCIFCERFLQIKIRN